MTLFLANQNFTVVVAGATVEVFRGDFYDDSTALYQAVAATSPPLFDALPDGIAQHRVSADWEG